MMVLENFADLARDAREVHVRIRQGDLSLQVVRDAEPKLTWDSHDDETPEVSREGDKLVVRQPEAFLGMRRMDVDIKLPPGADVYELHTGSGDLEASGLIGRVKAESGNGNGELRGVDGEIRATTGNGDVDVEAARGELRAHSGNGDVSLQAVEGTIEANTGHGDVDVYLRAPSELKAATGIGEIK